MLRYEESSQMIPTGFVCTGERVITIEGSIDAVCIAESLISKKLREYMEKDARNNNRSSNNTVYKVICFFNGL